MAEHRADKKDGWQRYDWGLIECDYVCSIPGKGLRKIAKKYGCNLKTVARHSKKDNWYQKRCEFLNNVRVEFLVSYRLPDAEQAYMEIVNADLLALGLDPITEISKKEREQLREALREEYR